MRIGHSVVVKVHVMASIASSELGLDGCVQKEREEEVARLLEERHQARELRRKEEYVKQCRLDLEKRRLEVPTCPAFPHH